MSHETHVLVLSAASVGLLHTILGPDHYLPFVVMSRARQWSRAKTALVTVACGVGHVASSVVLGLIGVAFGISLFRLEAFEATRGTVAAWLLVLFGLVYLVWGIRRGARGVHHTHLHAHANLVVHCHEHEHHGDHLHLHPSARGDSITPWALFTIFVFGPCEALIPLLMFPAAAHSLTSLILVTGVFAVATIGTMLVLVFLGVEGVRKVPFRGAERFVHAFAGGTVLACGLAILFLGL